MTTDARFTFSPKKPARKTVVSLHVNEGLYDRLAKYCASVGAVPGSIGRGTEHRSMQEVIRQMIDHCLTTNGF